MKQISLFIVLIGIVSTASSETVYELAQAHCKKAETIAGFAQGYRQLGKKASEATEKLMAISSKLIDPEIREEQEKQIFFIVQDAYTVPIYQTQLQKKQAVSEFEARHYLACSQSFQNTIDKKNK